MDFSFVITQFLSGLAWSHSLLLVAAGLALIFGIVNVLNFSHGSLFMFGTYVAYQVVVGWGMNFWLGFAAAGLVVAALGAIIEFGVIRYLYDRKVAVVYHLLATYSLILIFNDLVKIIWGSGFKSIPKPEYLQDIIDVGGAILPSYYLVIIAFGVLVMLSLWFLLHRTSYGRVIRAAALDRPMLDAMGVDTQKVYTLVFMLGTGIAGLGGALTGAMHTVAPGAGEEVIIEAIIICVIGGLGSIWGAWVGALILGQVNAFGILILPKWSLLFIYAVMVAVFMFKPQGLFPGFMTKGRH